jgi:hypothetical protein
MPRTLLDELNDLHDKYATAINLAVAEDDFRAAEELAEAYDDDAWHLVAEWEGKAHLLPALRAQHHSKTPVKDSPLRRLVRRLGAVPA